MSSESGASAPLRLERRRQRPLLQVERLSKFFSTSSSGWGSPRVLRAVDGVSLFVRHGECLGLIGAASAGKSVLGQTIVRLLEPTYGRVLLGERDVMRLPPGQLRKTRRDLQIVLQNASTTLNPRLPIGRQIAEGLTLHRIAPTAAEAEARVVALMEKLDLGPRLARAFPQELSAGERQRAALARTLALEPQLVVLDEPLQTLDPRSRTRVLELIARAQADKQMASLLISQDVPLVRRLAQRVAVLYAGRIVETGPTEELFARRAHPYSRALLAEAANQALARPRLRVVLEGDPFDPLARPRGCAFHPRCPRAERGRCDVVAPDLRQPGSDRSYRVACHHPHG